MRGSRSIKAFFFDVDGTLTSGTLILGTEGEAYKIFHAQDGMALGLAHRMGYITGFYYWAYFGYCPCAGGGIKSRCAPYGGEK